MKKGAGNEAEVAGQQPRIDGKRELGQKQRKEGEQVEENQAAGGAAELGEGERAGANPGHRQTQGKPLSKRMSWGPAFVAALHWCFCSDVGSCPLTGGRVLLKIAVTYLNALSSCNANALEREVACHAQLP